MILKLLTPIISRLSVTCLAEKQAFPALNKDPFWGQKLSPNFFNTRKKTVYLVGIICRTKEGPYFDGAFTFIKKPTINI